MTKPKILLVDDSQLILDVVGDALRRAGYEVIERSIAIGTSAAILRERPILALLDVSMPLMTGAEISEAVRGSSMARMTWVVLHSDRPESELRELARRCGADGFIRKTGDSKQLVDSVQSWVSRGRPVSEAAHILVACSPGMCERLARSLEAGVRLRFTDSGAEALRLVTSKDAPIALVVGTSIADVSWEVVYRTAVRSDPRWHSRFVIIDERDGSSGAAHQLRDVPCWSSHDPVSSLAATLNALSRRG